jgi:hypothetical protein
MKTQKTITMKALLNKTIFTLLFSLLVSGILAQEAQNDAVIRKMTREYTLKKDGSYDLHVYKEVELLTYYSFHRMFGETFIIYDPDYQKLKINKSYTVMADGKKVVTPENAFNEVLPRFASRAPAFNQMREMVVTHTGLERGAVIYLDYTIHTTAEFMPALMGNEVIPDEAPIEDMQLIIKVPSGKVLHHKALNSLLAPEVSNSGGMTVHTWNFKKVGPILPESNQDPHAVPRVIFTTHDDLLKVYFKFVNQPAFTHPTNEAMDKAVAGIVESSGEDELKIAMSLQDMVANTVATYNIPDRDIGFRARTPVEVWNTNGGTPLEKTLLLHTLLAKANISSAPVAAIPTNLYDPEHGNLMLIEDYFVRVNPRKYGWLYLSATSMNGQNKIYELGGQTLLVLDGAIESLKTYEEKDSKSIVRFGGTFAFEDDKALKGEGLAELTNLANPYLSLYQDSTKIKGLFHGARVNEFEFRTMNESRTVAELKVDCTGSLKSLSTYHFWTIPESRQGTSRWNINYLPAGRMTDFLVPDLLYERYEYNLSLPGNYTLVTPTNVVDIDNDFCKVKITLTRINNDVVIIRELEIKEKLVPAASYPQFKAAMDAWLNDRYRTLVFKKTE